jgi:hypothetical protein
MNPGNATRATKKALMITPGSWSDFGYRKLGPLPPSGVGWSVKEIADRLCTASDYEVVSEEWVRRRARRKGAQFTGSIEIVTVLDQGTPLNDQSLTFLEKHAESEWIKAESQWKQFRADPEVLKDAVERAETVEERWRGVYRLTQALFYIGPEVSRLRPMFRQHVAPCFFRLYPQGKIIVLRYDTEADGAAALLRLLYATSQAPPQELLADRFKGIQTLQQWHMASLTRLMPVLLDFFNDLFYPKIGGACACLYGLVFLFLFDPAEDYAPAAFPRNWLGFAGRSASFGREAGDLMAVVQDFAGQAHQRESHQRFCHSRSFGADDRLKLLHWYIDHVNRLLYELTDAANFTEGADPQAVLDPVFAFEHQLTVDRLLRKTLMAISLDEAPAGNLMSFEIADLYDTLSERFGNHNKKTDFFKKLFHTEEGPALLVPRLAAMPSPFDAYFADLARQVYDKIEETVLASVWRPGKLTPGGVLVRDRDLAKETAIPLPQFVAEVMRAYRNAHHGYFSADPISQNRPLRFLFLVNGNLPVEMSALPSLWYLAYLADPGFVGWKPLGINSFE